MQDVRTKSRTSSIQSAGTLDGARRGSNRRHSSISLIDKGPDAYFLEVPDPPSRTNSSQTTLPPRPASSFKKARKLHFGVSDATKEKHARRALAYGNRVQHGVENTALASTWAGGRLGGAAAVVCTYAQWKEMWPAGNFVGGALMGGTTYAVGSGAGLLAGGPIAAVAGRHWLKKHGKEHEAYDWPMREKPPMEMKLPGKRWKYSIPEKMHLKPKSGDSEEKENQRVVL